MGWIERKAATTPEGKTTVKYKARYRDPTGRERSRTFPRKIDADRFLTTVQARMLRGDWTDPDLGKTTLAEWAPRWLDSKRSLKPKTRYGYESVVRRILPVLGDYPLGKLDRLHVEGFVTGLMAEQLSPSRIRQCQRILSALLDAAVANRLITHNVARGVEVPRLVPPKRRFLTHEQVRDLADAVDPRYRVLILVFAYSGVRWGEATALRRGSCDLLRRRLHITESVTQIGAEHVWGTPKTHRNRSVQLPAFVCDDLARHLLRNVAPEPDALVFTAPRGGVWNHSDFRQRVWGPALEAAGLPETLKVHELRHTAASLLIAAGAGPKSVQAQLGHSTITTTFDVYGHLFEGHLDGVMDDIDRHWRQPVSDEQRRDTP